VNGQIVVKTFTLTTCSLDIQGRFQKLLIDNKRIYFRRINFREHKLSRIRRKSIQIQKQLINPQYKAKLCIKTYYGSQ